MSKSEEWDKREEKHSHYWENLWNEMISHKPLICIPKTGDILLIDIEKHRFLICIGRLIISSVSGIWLRK